MLKFRAIPFIMKILKGRKPGRGNGIGEEPGQEVKMTDKYEGMAADVVYETKDTKCGGHVLVFVSGSVSAVKAAVESVESSSPCKIFNSAVISNPSEEMIEIVEDFKSRYNK